MHLPESLAELLPDFKLPDPMAAPALNWGIVGPGAIAQSFVSQLRHKLEADSTHPRYLLTELGMGYRFVTTA